MLVACLSGPTAEAIRDQILKNRDSADLFELRGDLYEIPDVSYLKSLTSKPFIVTNAFANLEYIDIALEHWKNPSFLEKYPKVKWVCSYHNYEETPNNLTEIFETMRGHPAYLYKVVTMARCATDGLRMMRLVKEAEAAGVRIVGHCMGEWGQFTRIAGKVFGNHWTYCSAADAVAPGQLSIEGMTQTYRYPSLDSKTQLYGLIGDPVCYSRSHSTHNREFVRRGLNALYVKIRVKSDELKPFLDHASFLGFRGFSVTMPLKEQVGRLCSPFLEACNTLSITEGIQGFNTDGPAAAALLKRHQPLAGKKALIIGAGGVGKAIRSALVEEGVECTVLNRSPKPSTVPLSYWDGANLADYAFIIQATSVGMGDAEVAPVNWSLLKKHHVVFETISAPEETALVRMARAKGCAIITGSELFFEQAKGQFDYWGL